MKRVSCVIVALQNQYCTVMEKHMMPFKFLWDFSFFFTSNRLAKQQQQAPAALEAEAAFDAQSFHTANLISQQHPEKKGRKRRKTFFCCYFGRRGAAASCPVTSQPEDPLHSSHVLPEPVRVLHTDSGLFPRPKDTDSERGELANLNRPQPRKYGR